MATNDDLAYGAWIAPDDTVYKVVDMCHHRYVATHIVTKLFGHEPREKSVYNILFRLGYVRVVYENQDGFTIDSVEYWHAAKLSRYQHDIVKESSYKTVRENCRDCKGWY